MENLRRVMQKHKAVSYITVLGFIVFINCFGFPVYNLNKEWAFGIKLSSIYNSVLGSAAIGASLAALFPDKRPGFIVSLTVALSCLGLACRFLLEFGEVSNTYNFTPPNITLHLVTFVVLTALSWSAAKRAVQLK